MDVEVILAPEEVQASRYSRLEMAAAPRPSSDGVMEAQKLMTTSLSKYINLKLHIFFLLYISLSKKKQSWRYLVYQGRSRLWCSTVDCRNRFFDFQSRLCATDFRLRLRLRLYVFTSQKHRLSKVGRAKSTFKKLTSSPNNGTYHYYHLAGLSGIVSLTSSATLFRPFMNHGIQELVW